MADQFLVVIPADPSAPLPPKAEALRDALARLAGTDEARIKDYGKLQFIDAGQNAASIHCPSCNAPIETTLWHDWMQTDWHGADGFHLHKHTTPCCGTSVSLNELVYRAPQGFARWMISARDNGHGPLTPDERVSIETLGELKLTAIAQRY
ncbi:MAG: hypothetical protein AAFY03_11625 [Pseudomonadota bacterium]